jgi:hypothetical protein
VEEVEEVMSADPGGLGRLDLPTIGRSDEQVGKVNWEEGICYTDLGGRRSEDLSQG